MKKSRTEFPVGRCTGNRWENTAPSAATVHLDDVPDELLELVFLRLPASLHLVRAACTCKRWRRVVADGGFLRRFRDLHPRPLVVGHYRVDRFHYGSCPPGCNPVFSLSPSADTTVHLRPQHLSLDFLPACDGGFWDLADSRCGILLLHKRTVGTEEKVWLQLRHLVVCDPTKRRCSRVIGPPAFHDRQLLGAFLLDSNTEEADGGRISVRSFRIMVALYDNGIARSCVFSSSNGGGWTMAMSKVVNLARSKRCIFYAGHVAESVYWATFGDEIIVLDKDAGELKVSSFPFSLLLDCSCASYVMHSRFGIVRCHDGTVRIACLAENHIRVFIQTAASSDEWVLEKSIEQPQHMLTKIVSVAEGSITLGTEGGVGLVSVDLATKEFRSVDEHDGNKYNGPAHMYQLPWPPTIRACLP